MKREKKKVKKNSFLLFASTLLFSPHWKMFILFFFVRARRVLSSTYSK